MELKLNKRPKNVTIIQGLPGFGLVGTIATEYLINHLDTEMIGKIINKQTQAMVAIHEHEVVEPLGIFYNKKYNLIILHAVTTVQGLEWVLADQIDKLAKAVTAKEVVCIEGVGSRSQTASTRTFCYCSNPKMKAKMEKMGVKALKEGIILGGTAALMLKTKLNLTCIFAETVSELPDSGAAARTIEIIDKYLGLKVDVAPLQKQAAIFETKLKSILSKGKEAKDMSEQKMMSYVG